MKQIQKLTVLTFLLTVYVAFSFAAVKKEYLWPKGKMPDSQQHQIAALKSVASQKDFNADKNRLPISNGTTLRLKGSAREPA